MKSGAMEAVQWGRVLAGKPGHLSSVPRTHHVSSDHNVCTLVSTQVNTNTGEHHLNTMAMKLSNALRAIEFLEVS